MKNSLASLLNEGYRQNNSFPQEHHDQEKNRQSHGKYNHNHQPRGIIHEKLLE